MDVVPEDILERRLWVLAQLTNRLAQAGIRPILVGGTAVALYTAGSYFTADMDIVASNRRLAAQALQEMGFQPEGRHWVHQEWDIAVEIPDTDLAGDPKRVVQVELPDGSCVYCIGVEDLLIDRLNAAVHWRSLEDRRWAKELLKLHNRSLDREYLWSRAQQEGVLGLLNELQSEVSGTDEEDEVD